jgi:hypothetical protein
MHPRCRDRIAGDEGGELVKEERAQLRAKVQLEFNLIVMTSICNFNSYQLVHRLFGDHCRICLEGSRSPDSLS